MKYNLDSKKKKKLKIKFEKKKISEKFKFEKKNETECGKTFEKLKCYLYYRGDRGKKPTFYFGNF